ncbi:MAG: NUDIX hydrolase [Thermodesulfovibrionales bacterium]
MRHAKIKIEVSSGGVIFRKRDDRIEVALVAVKDGRVWCLPKGLIEKGEDERQTAVREVMEETGLTGRIIDKIGDISYWYFIKEENVRCKKTVHFYLLEFISGDTEGHSWEVDRAGWFEIDEALRMLSYKDERDILNKAREMLYG